MTQVVMFSDHHYITLTALFDLHCVYYSMCDMPGSNLSVQSWGYNACQRVQAQSPVERLLRDYAK